MSEEWSVKLWSYPTVKCPQYYFSADLTDKPRSFKTSRQPASFFLALYWVVRVLWWIKSVLIISSLKTLSLSSSSQYSTQQYSGICLSQQHSLLFWVPFPVPRLGLYDYWYADSLLLLFMPSVMNWHVENRYLSMDVLLYCIIAAKILSSWLVFTLWLVDHS